LVLRERVKGAMPFLLEQIDEDSIAAFKIRGDDNGK
jgi:predicted ribosome quality control (RQC) complex YloA/Tae2 family protein